MCGIVGVVSTERRLSPQLLVRMRDALVHRGPDDAGLWLADDLTVALGHRRLSIIDLAHGHQPMLDPTGAIVLSFNGEIYNHVELRRELELAGRSFATRCDTEVLLAAYERWGEGCVSRLDGMFAFLIWDAGNRRLFFARDRLGKKPLYYTRTRDGYAFASETKALLEHPDATADVDRQSLAHYMSFLVVPAPATLFAGINKLPAAHCGTWSQDEGIATRRYWAVPEPLDVDMTLDEAAQRVMELFTTAVGRRMMSDVPFGVYLSGGVDSSANVAMMSEISSERIRTFSVAFADEPSLDELAHARRVAKIFGTEHREVVVDDAMVIESLPALVHHQDEPIADPVCVPLLHLAQLTKASGVTVVQIGEGSDEIFRGYPVYSQVFENATRLRLAGRVVPRRLLISAVRYGAIEAGLKREFVLESLRRGIPPAHGIAGFAEAQKARLLGAEAYETGHDYLYRQFGSGWSADEISRVSLAHELDQRLAELLLMRVDKMTMAASVEGRAPFLDRDLVEFAAQLPLRLHWQAGLGKRVLKRALADVLPNDVLTRRKQGFGAPVWRWMDSLRPLAERELFRPAIADHLDMTVVRALLDAPRTTRRGFELWVVLNFALWHRHFVERDDLRGDPLIAALAKSAVRRPAAATRAA